MKSKTFIDIQAKRKLNPELVETILAAKKHDKWVEVAGMLSSSRKNHAAVNIRTIEKETKEGDTIVVPGKVLGDGEVTKKIRVVALSFSREAEKKLKDKKCEVVKLKDEIKSNPKAQGVKIIK